MSIDLDKTYFKIGMTIEAHMVHTHMYNLTIFVSLRSIFAGIMDW